MNARKAHVLVASHPDGWSFCSCGYKTGPLRTFTRQTEWHRAHKKLAKIEQDAKEKP